MGKGSAGLDAASTAGAASTSGAAGVRGALPFWFLVFGMFTMSTKYSTTASNSGEVSTALSGVVLDKK